MTCPAWADDRERDPAFVAHAEAVGDAVASDSTPLRVAIVNRWHRNLFKGWVPLTDYAGNMRQVTASMPCLNGDVLFGGRLGSAPGVVASEMQVLCAAINTRTQQLDRNADGLTDEALVGAVAAAVARAVAEFIRIHPYVNGNGRTSRVLWRAVAGRLGFPASISVGERPQEPYVSCLHEAINGRIGPLVARVLMTISTA